ncbi:pyridoxamine 5'-phosphate oxidase family protein [Bacillus sp. DJP31]|uniref:pyridoxamine 5'-phosphate oxidase family protein n=1 Tax=Bacillus sp. DJP31 TaxID=3409789 RepID=UPI003BB5629B
MNHVFKNILSSEEELRSLLGEPSKRAQDKLITKIDTLCETMIKHSPFLVLSTSNLNGTCDASPRGDAPGFVHIIDEKHILIPERPGNKRIDSLRNVMANPHVGLLFFIPGMQETLRINGKAFIIRDQEWLEKMAVNDRLPLVGIVVEVEEIFIHCAKAFIRSGLWDQATWPQREKLPTMAEVLKVHASLDTALEEIDESLIESYTQKLY